MRTVLEIVVIGLLVGAVFYFVGQGRSIKERSDRMEQVYKDSLKQMDDSLSFYEQSIIDINKEKDSLRNKLASQQGKEDSIKKAYTDSIESIQEAKLSELIDSSRIIIKGSQTFVLVSEKYYRQSRIDRVELKKLKALVGIYRDKVQTQDRIIEVQGDEIMNLMEQVAIYQHKVNLKDSVIQEKEMDEDFLKDQVGKFKWQRNGVIGAAVGAIVLILL